KPSNKRKTTEPFKLQNYFNFQDIVETEWEDSDLCEYLTSAKFLLVIFEETSNDEELFKGVKFWRMPSIDLNGLVYDTCKRIIDNNQFIHYIMNILIIIFQVITNNDT